MTDHTTKRRVETRNEGLSCPQHLRPLCPPLHPMKCGKTGTMPPWHHRVRGLAPHALLLRSASREILEQRLGLLQVHGLKTLGEPAIDRRQQRRGLSPLALLLPEAT